MASYLPSQLQPPLGLTLSAQDVGKPASGHLSIFRTLIVQANATSRTFTANMSAGTDGQATQIFSGYALTFLVPSIFNLWLIADTSKWLSALASHTSNTVILQANGYDYTI